MMTGLNIRVSLFHRDQDADDDIGGSVQRISPYKTNVPARIGPTPTQWNLVAQGITVQDVFPCTIESPDYTILEITQDDVLIPEAGHLIGLQFFVMSVQESSLLDNPIDYRGWHANLSIKRLIPPASIV